ncbi:AbrB/MazE/SpoVT family DNA-binding domain-containing protein [Sansalvadorimonas verongulae]|uniref:AbrB/MazE/SpoVT family DNA-binding domain-containing protein n=1 Tax=Sansalvadorimonas verongulae TaxID=2172824 RepID=UPI0012BC5088|nr:AbrB/MazE/SpoVT family DNA-binding domain-containing protein [Sansalvadorimonas verongulae]MTI11960.1 AbrB/MazE/SpoVT family DNA-binding domain-containing protein [Sansalvadorimonas verongulae]
MRAQIRKIGNSAGTIIPAAILREMSLSEGDDIMISNTDGCIIIEPVQEKPKYSLDELLAKCDENAPMPEELKEWDEAPAVGNEAW